MGKQRLIVFMRFPRPGQTKTRLIPALGPDGASTLHGRLAKHALDHVKPLPGEPADYELEVRYADASDKEMRTWLGDSCVIAPQTGADLGERMHNAFVASHAANIDATVIVGTDAPDMNRDRVSEAFAKLATHDLVLGPALDGGYTLIGLKSPNAALFSQVAWGTSSVLATTEKRAASLGLSLACIAPLTDIDRPEDLAYLRQQWPDLLAGTRSSPT